MLKPFLRAATLTFVAAASVSGQAKLNKYGYPEKHAPRPTSQAITPEDLMTRLYIFSDDSMQGRQFGRIGNMKGTNYIAGEVKRLGLQAAGDNGTYFQKLPMLFRHFTEKSSMTADGARLKFNTDFVALPTTRAPKPIQNVAVIFGGTAGDTTTLISADQAAGKFVVLLPAPGQAGVGRGGRGGGGGAGAFGTINACSTLLNPMAGGATGARGRGGFGGGGGNAVPARFANAAAVATADLDMLPVGDRGFLNMPTAQPQPYPPTGTQPVVIIRNGQVATLKNGQVVSGQLPSGMTAQQVQQMMDSIRTDSVTRMARNMTAVALERVHACAVTDSIAVSHGAASMIGSGGIAAAEAAAIQAPANFGGRGAGGGGRGGRGAVDPNAPAPTASLRITRAAAEKLLGRPVDGMAVGAAGKTVSANLDFEEKDASDWARNVVAIVPGSDPTLKGEYVLVSAHNDHMGYSAPGGIMSVIDHDSLKSYNDIRTVLAISKRPGDLAQQSEIASELAAIHINVDSLHKIRPARKDSINNGADDDGSGSIAILEIAEYIAKMPVKPKRSTLFVWQTGEEAGLNGSAYFATHPTVPADSIVADINIDMIGRGRAEDIPGGGPTYVGVVGSGFLSKDLAQIVASTNLKQKQPLNLDAKFDLPTIWPGYNNIYGRSDHFNYAKQCIPIAFFFTGLHGDYHQRTDEAQYIDYPHYSLITNYIRDVILELDNRPLRPSLDKPCTRA